MNILIFIKQIEQIIQLYENQPIIFPTKMANNPSPKDPNITNVVPSLTVNLYPNYYGTTSSKGYKTESHKPNKMDMNIKPNYALTQNMKKKLIKLVITLKRHNIFILQEGFPETAARANLKKVMEIQYKELQKVACSFVLKLFNTAYELIHPP